MIVPFLTFSVRSNIVAAVLSFHNSLFGKPSLLCDRFTVMKIHRNNFVCLSSLFHKKIVCLKFKIFSFIYSASCQSKPVCCCLVYHDLELSAPKRTTNDQKSNQHTFYILSFCMARAA